MPKSTRHRQLARVAQRRYAERRRRKRQRVRVIAASLVIGLIGLTVAALAFLSGGQERTAASRTPTPSESPGTQTGTVQPPKVAKDVACGATAPAAASRPKPQFNAPATAIDRSRDYTATIRTSCGTIVVRLLTDRAPKTVNSFVFLARRHYFDGTTIHRIDTGLDVIQGGDPEGTGSGGPGYTIPDELTGKESYGPGVVAMANAGPDSGGSQFFIVFGPGGHELDSTPNYTIFGTVAKGLDVVRRIGALPIVDPKAAAAGDLSGQRPEHAVYLEKVTVSD